MSRLASSLGLTIEGVMQFSRAGMLRIEVSFSLVDRYSNEGCLSIVRSYGSRFGIVYNVFDIPNRRFAIWIKTNNTTDLKLAIEGLP